MRAFADALTAIRRSPFQAIAALLVIAQTYFLAYSFSMFLLVSHQVVSYFETRPQVIAFFDLEIADEFINDVAGLMESKSYVEEVTIVSQDEALEIYQQENRDEQLLLELVTSDIFPASIEVSGKDVTSLSRIKQDLDEIPGIDEIIFQEDVINSLNSIVTLIRRIGISSTTILGITSLLIIAIIMALKLSSNRYTVNVMRMLGATTGFIKAPYVIEGMFYALIGSLLGFGGMLLGLLYLEPILLSFFTGIELTLFDVEILGIMAGGGTVIGVFLAGLASDFAVGRLLKK